jgi:tripartite-type tricarboxylate transporter receptor subunit TctC
MSAKWSIGPPTVPVPDELGLKFPLLSSYFAIVGPPGLDKEKVKILENAIMKAAVHPDYVAWSSKVSTAQPALVSAKEYKAEIENFNL